MNANAGDLAPRRRTGHQRCGTQARTASMPSIAASSGRSIAMSRGMSRPAAGDGRDYWFRLYVPGKRPQPMTPLILLGRVDVANITGADWMTWSPLDKFFLLEDGRQIIFEKRADILLIEPYFCDTTGTFVSRIRRTRRCGISPSSDHGRPGSLPRSWRDGREWRLGRGSWAPRIRRSRPAGANAPGHVSGVQRLSQQWPSARPPRRLLASLPRRLALGTRPLVRL